MVSYFYYSGTNLPRTPPNRSGTPKGNKHFMIQYNSQRIAILIDTANLYHTAKHVYRSKVHFESLIHAIASNRSITRAIAYAITSDNASESGFLETLTAAGIEVRTKPLITYRQGNQKADWDVGIAIDAVALADHIDTLIIVSGDGDFAPLVTHMRSQGVRVEAAAFDQSVSQLLIDVVDWYHDLSKLSDIILINPRNPFMSRTETTGVSDTQSNGQNVFDKQTITAPRNQKDIAQTKHIPITTSKVNRQFELSNTITEQDKLATMHSGVKKVAPVESATDTPVAVPEKETVKRRYYSKKK